MTSEQPLAIKYYFHDLLGDQENYHLAALREFSDITVNELPPGVMLQSASDDEVRMIKSSLETFPSSTLRGLLGRAGSTGVPSPFAASAGPLAIFCSRESAFATLTRAENPHAEWGATCGHIAIIYTAFNKHLTWHELFHVLGAEDCYLLPDQGPTCILLNCIMQYAPTQVAVGEWPFLCEQNLESVRTRMLQLHRQTLSAEP